MVTVARAVGFWLAVVSRAEKRQRCDRSVGAGKPRWHHKHDSETQNMQVHESRVSYRYNFLIICRANKIGRGKGVLRESE